MKFTSDIRFASDDEYVCWCSCISKGEVLRAIQQGAKTIDDIRAVTGACTQERCAEKNPRGR